MNQEQTKQVIMHKDFFDKCQFAIDNQFYIEAILLDYAAIESRLEAICGIVGLPCGKNCLYRKEIAISSRIKCLSFLRNHNEAIFKTSKLPQNFLKDSGILKKWITERNIIVHGLYKNSDEYSLRLENNKALAEDGMDYARLLYNEAKRLRRIEKNYPEIFNQTVLICKSKKCKAKIEENK